MMLWELVQLDKMVDINSIVLMVVIFNNGKVINMHNNTLHYEFIYVLFCFA